MNLPDLEPLVKFTAGVALVILLSSMSVAALVIFFAALGGAVKSLWSGK